jgi:predicted naringenin-chalcone synthase
MSETGLIDLCREACNGALEKASLSVQDVDYVIAAYEANPFLSPGLSQLLVPNLSLDPYTRLVNVQGIASTAFPKALELADNYLAIHSKDHVLLCISGVTSYWFQNQVRGLKDVIEISRINQINDKAKKAQELRKWVATMQFFLFGDGVAAAIITGKDKGLTVGKIAEVTNVGEKDYLAGYSRLSTLNEPFKFGFYSHLDKEIPNLGARYTGLALKKLLGKDSERVTKSAKKWAVHTGSAKILETLADNHGIDRNKLKESREVLMQYGNLAGASLPFILERIISHSKFSNGDIILMVGYGWGFSASACMLEYRE